jgi:hypothetical protein
MELMTPEHTKWNEFCGRLSDLCDFRKKEGREVWNCDHDFAFATPLLEDYGVDVPQTIKFFREHGGYCDCEILFNVDTGGE